MSQFPNTAYPPAPLFNVSTLSLNSIGGSFPKSGGIASTVWPTANLAIFTPFRLNQVITFSTIVAENGATVSGNIDVGVYSVDGTRLVSLGGVAQATVSTVKRYSVTTTELGPGVYYMAMVLDNITGTVFGNAFTITPLGQTNAFLGMAQAATSYPLPATVTLASNTTNFMPLMGLSTRSFT